MKQGTKISLKALAWGGSVALVLIAGVYYFPREYPGMKLWEAIYATLRLFVFERDQEQFPQHWQLIALYFIAPAIALSAAGTVVSYLFKISPSIRSRWMRDHVVICGVGRAGKLLAKTLLDAGVPVVGIDLGPPEAFEEWLGQNRLPLIYGNFHSRPLLEQAGAVRARSVVFASGDDLANLEGAINAYEMLHACDGPVRLIWTHIANERLADVAREAVKTEGRVGIRFFDTYRIAAVKMIATYFNRETRRGVNEVNILGFGKFGRDLFDILLGDLSEEDTFAIKVVDIHERGAEVFTLAEEAGVIGRVGFERAAIQELDLEDEVDKAFFLCTDDDLGNLTAAMMLARKEKATHIYVRMARWPLAAMAEHLGEEQGVVFVNINELMTQGLEELPGIFGPAKEEDLKRRANRTC